MVHGLGVLADDAYLRDVQAIVDHVGTKPGVYVLVSLWNDDTFTSLGWATPSTLDEWRKLASALKDRPQVLFGIVNEPQSNFDGARDADVWRTMNDAVAAIRAVEDAAGTPHHVISVQGTRAWARRLDYYVGHPITAGGGDNIAYETHVYDPPAMFGELFETPARSLPVLIGEFGPSGMTEADTTTLMERAEAIGVPYLAWTFHMRCPPNLLVDNSGNGCGIDMALAPTSWGMRLRARLLTPW